MTNVQNSKNNKFQIVNRNNFGVLRNLNDYFVTSKKEINDDILFDINNEKEFIENKINRKYNNIKGISTITKTIKYEYKISKENNKNNNINNYNEKINNNSTLLRNHSNILNNRPLDSFFDISRKTIDNNKISNLKFRKIEGKTKKRNEDKYKDSPINKGNKGFENFSLSKVCGSSHPIKEKNKRNNDKIKKSNTNYEYKFIKSYMLKYSYKENNNISNKEEDKININAADKINFNNNDKSNFNNKDNKHIIVKNNDNINHKSAININNNDKNVVNYNKNKILREYNNYKIGNKKNQNPKNLSNRNSKKLFLADSSEKKDTKVLTKKQSIKNDYKIKKYVERNKDKEFLKKSLKSYNYIPINNKNKHSALEKENKNNNTIDINKQLNKRRNYYFMNNKDLKENNKTLFNKRENRDISGFKNFSYRNLEITEKARCVMPPNNLRNIFLQNEAKFFNKTKLFL